MLQSSLCTLAALRFGPLVHYYSSFSHVCQAFSAGWRRHVEHASTMLNAVWSLLWNTSGISEPFGLSESCPGLQCPARSHLPTPVTYWPRLSSLLLTLSSMNTTPCPPVPCTPGTYPNLDAGTQANTSATSGAAARCWSRTSRAEEIALPVPPCLDSDAS